MGSEVFAILEVVRLDFDWTHSLLSFCNLDFLAIDQPAKMKKPSKTWMAIPASSCVYYAIFLFTF
jgi:hypothetical protein